MFLLILQIDWVQNEPKYFLHHTPDFHQNLLFQISPNMLTDPKKVRIINNLKKCN